MDDGGFDHSELENSQSSIGVKKSSRTNFLLFLLVFGWEGPLGIFIWFWNGDVGFLIAGLILTAFFWGLFGISELKDFIKGERQ